MFKREYRNHYKLSDLWLVVPVIVLVWTLIDIGKF